jgi:hypothetical protein
MRRLTSARILDLPKAPMPHEVGFTAVLIRLQQGHKTLVFQG